MGRRVDYMYMIKRLKSIWKLQGDFQLTNLGNEFFFMKLFNIEDKYHILFRGP
ncbi:hypothetical protein NC651_007374 [Populus alba x Populus x berolinensis]|nr:hypothetical protein NC651_007374 [Populus alba x Populus x berolinensis]